MAKELSLNNILKFLNERSFKPTLEAENNQIFIEIEIGSKTIPIFFGVISEGMVLQLIAYLPFLLNQQTIPEVARLLHFVNKEIDIPGFGMDEKSGYVFFRSVLPCLEKKFDERVLELYLATTRVICETFINAIELVSTGKTNLETVIKEKMQAP